MDIFAKVTFCPFSETCCFTSYCVLDFHGRTGVAFSNGTMLSMSDKYDSVNERTHEIDESMELHILGV